MTVESKDLEVLAREAIIRQIALDAEKKGKSLEEIVVDAIVLAANSTIPASERVQKLPTTRDFKKHITEKGSGQK